MDELILRAYISGNQLSEVETGKSVKVRFDVPGGVEETSGTVSWISPSAEFTPKIIQTKEERVNLVYAIKVTVPNDGRLKIGMPGEGKKYLQRVNKEIPLLFESEFQQKSWIRTNRPKGSS